MNSEIMDKLFSEARALLPAIERKYIIGNYCGIRPKQAPPGEGGPCDEESLGDMALYMLEALEFGYSVYRERN